ncbi:MAG: energy coupling factor transporter S component ThiW [Clostridiaceae bacterium]|nr:energy coupling factor transporter S component ThiW [Clostridiaceae bacterium]
MKVRTIAYSAILIAFGVVGGYFIYFPIGASKCTPVQHIINVLAAVLLGPGYAVLTAFCISVIRNILGTGTLLAFPGSMVGAFLAGLLYKKTNSKIAAAAGEIFGTGILGAIIAWPIAKFLLNSDAAAFFFVGPFLLNTTVGSIIAFLILKAVDFAKGSANIKEGQKENKQ